jgi:hypothetical protein
VSSSTSIAQQLHPFSGVDDAPANVKALAPGGRKTGPLLALKTDARDSFSPSCYPKSVALLFEVMLVMWRICTPTLTNHRKQ